MTHCNVIALLSESCNPLDGIFKHGSMVLKAIATVAKNNPFSVFVCYYFEIYSKYNGELYEYNISNTM